MANTKICHSFKILPNLVTLFVHSRALKRKKAQGKFKELLGMAVR